MQDKTRSKNKQQIKQFSCYPIIYSFKYSQMGNKNSNKNNSLSLPQNWVTASEPPSSIFSHINFYRTRLLVNTVTYDYIEQYNLHFISQEDLNAYLIETEWRQGLQHRDPSAYFPSVRAFINKSSHELCSRSFAASIYFDKIQMRLTEINDIPFLDALYMLRICFQGFKVLMQHFGYFRITEEQVFINRDGEVKVWIHGNLSNIIGNKQQKTFLNLRQKKQEDMGTKKPSQNYNNYNNYNNKMLSFTGKKKTTTQPSEYLHQKSYEASQKNDSLSEQSMIFDIMEIVEENLDSEAAQKSMIFSRYANDKFRRYSAEGTKSKNSSGSQKIKSPATYRSFYTFENILELYKEYIQQQKLKVPRRMEVIYDIYKNKPIEVPEKFENNYQIESRVNKKKKSSSSKAQNDSFASYNSQKADRPGDHKQSPFYSSNNDDRNKIMLTNGKGSNKNEQGINNSPNNWLNINQSLFHGHFDESAVEYIKTNTNNTPNYNTSGSRFGSPSNPVQLNHHIFTNSYNHKQQPNQSEREKQRYSEAQRLQQKRAFKQKPVIEEFKQQQYSSNSLKIEENRNRNKNKEQIHWENKKIKTDELKKQLKQQTKGIFGDYNELTNLNIRNDYVNKNNFYNTNRNNGHKKSLNNSKSSHYTNSKPKKIVTSQLNNFYNKKNPYQYNQNMRPLQLQENSYYTNNANNEVKPMLFSFQGGQANTNFKMNTNLVNAVNQKGQISQNSSLSSPKTNTPVGTDSPMQNTNNIHYYINSRNSANNMHINPHFKMNYSTKNNNNKNNSIDKQNTMVFNNQMGSHPNPSTPQSNNGSMTMSHNNMQMQKHSNNYVRFPEQTMSKYQSPLSTLLEQHENRHRIIRTNNMQQSPNNIMATSINMNNNNNSNNKYIKFSYPSEALIKKASDYQQRQDVGKKEGEGKLGSNNGKMGHINTLKYVKTPYIMINSNNNSNNNSNSNNNNNNNNNKPNSVTIQLSNPTYIYNGNKKQFLSPAKNSVYINAHSTNTPIDNKNSLVPNARREQEFKAKSGREEKVKNRQLLYYTQNQCYQLDSQIADDLNQININDDEDKSPIPIPVASNAIKAKINRRI